MPAWLPWALVLGAWFCVVLVRVTGPLDFVDGDHQERQAAYVLDVLDNGHWAFQENQTGELAGKPPLYTWISAVAALVGGGAMSPLALYAPAMLATLGIAGLLLLWGRRNFGVWAGLLAAVFFLFSPSGLKMVFLARIDGLFSFLVLATLLLGFSAWQGRANWILFWLAAAAATLAKGPLGLVLGGCGLLAWFWERWHVPADAEQSPQSVRIPGAAWKWHLAGVLLYLLVCGGWFLWAWHVWEKPFIDRVIYNELLGHAGGGGGEKKHGFAGWLLQPSGYLIARFLPWSLLGAAGIWRAVARPAASADARRLERVLVCAVAVGLLLFTVASHRRPDLLFPLMPPLALLAGREVALWWRPEARRRAPLWLAVVLVAGCAGALVYYHGKSAQKREEVICTRGVAEVNRRLKVLYPTQMPRTLYTLDAAVGIQVYANTLERHVTPEAAAAALSGDEVVLVVTGNAAAVKALLPPGTAAYEVVPWPEQNSKVKDFMSVLSNWPAPSARVPGQNEPASDKSAFPVKLEDPRPDAVGQP